MKTKRAFIVRDFKDGSFENGAERRFTAGAIEDLPEGVFTNYEHAGLVRAPTPDDKKVSTTAAA